MHRYVLSSLMKFCVFLSIGVLVVTATDGQHSRRSNAAGTASRSTPRVLPAGLLPILAQTLSKNSTVKWHASRTGQGAQSTNPTQHLSIRLDAQDLHLITRSHDNVTMRLISYMQGIHPAALHRSLFLQLRGTRVTLAHGAGLTEWYESSPLGVEQGFELAHPFDAGAMSLTFTLHTSLKTILYNNALEFRDRDGKTVLHYGELLAYDASHRLLPAHMSLTDDRLSLEVDTRGARYPVTIDPFFTTPTAFSDPNATPGDSFGYSVALSADGSTALIGAESAASGAGAAYVYTSSGGVWNTTPVVSFSDPASIPGADVFGTSVAISADGSTALVGAAGTSVNAGAAYIFTETGGVWSTTPVVSLSDPAATAEDEFGNNVALSADGNTALIGAIGTKVATKIEAGSAYVFTATGGVWSTSPVVSFTDPAVTAGDLFGNSVSLSEDGGTALIGAYYTASKAGAAYVFTATDGVWTLIPAASFGDPAVTAGDLFGYSVAISGDGDTALIGAIGTDSDAGAAYVFRAIGGTWSVSPVASFSDPLTTPGIDVFGWSVALSGAGDAALIGSYDTNSARGAAYVFNATDGIWSPTPGTTFNDPPGIVEDQFGNSVALSADGSTALIGAVGTGSFSGKAYAFNSPASNLIEFDVPGASTAPGFGTQPLSNNDSGAIVGFYTDENIVPHGFLRNNDGTILSFDAPGAGLGAGLDQGTVAYSINDQGVIAGQYEDSNYVFHGFVRAQDGTFTTIDVTGAGTGTNQGTLTFNINLAGATAGIYIDGNYVQHGYVSSAAGGITAFDPKGSVYTMVCEETCLKSNGAVTGYYADSSGGVHGFLRKKNGKIISIDAPGAASFTICASINASGTITGYFVDSNNVAHGFIRTSDGTFTKFHVPGASRAPGEGTAAFSINMPGAVTGEYFDATSVMHGFYRSARGIFKTFDAPDAGTMAGQGTRPSTNNLTKTVVGWYIDGNNVLHGFVWHP